MSNVTVNLAEPKVMRHLIKLQQYNGTGSLDTFLTKFQRMVTYQQWDDEDMFYYLCPRLKGAVGQVLLDIGPRATTIDIVHLLQTRFGTQLQAEHFKAEMLHARRRAPGDST